ncbi:epoxyqueuosine reductase QueH [Peptoniphilus equinus]|uniref:Epoxyqueuosine reductase QueH n=1 Tax=Peptoniphilus equinus TaxID=3016343 RepID=A0ABY7QVG5_9FIRM|nr:epoxyqueuosine reductase QueH [Peptoniphilus equinus]WBW50235.1 epoxyqueuosine reductase QueH [Peptoniphilus equinus]
MRKPNYNETMIHTLEDFEGRPKIVLHVCCAPCSTASIERLLDYGDITCYFFNDNLDSEREFHTRYGELERLAATTGWPVTIEKQEYDHERFLNRVRGLEEEREGGKRCMRCYHDRLMETAIFAKAHGYDFFTTTLTISPHKDSAVLNRMGEAIGNKVGVPFLHADFKKQGGFKRSTELSKAYALYRQDYCGCEFSKEEARKRAESLDKQR